jgi:aerobic-type carbon monoxide dehydrogenase small subunit (CoxS/CutS family)
MDKTFIINVDGTDHAITANPTMPLLYALRNQLGKKGPRFGCGLAQCGACTVIQDGVPIRSCVVPIAAIKGKVRTLDGLGTFDHPHPVQRAFIAEEAGQCEYCMSGWIMTSVAMLEQDPQRSESEIRDALTGLKCRCGAHMSILRAIKRAAYDMASMQANDGRDD